MEEEIKPSTSQLATHNRRWILGTSALLLFAIFGFACGAWLRMHTSLPAVAIQSEAPLGPEWGRPVSALQLKQPTFKQAIDTLGRLSGAKIVIDWTAMPDGVTPQTVLPVDIDVHDASLANLLPWLVSKAWKKDRFVIGDIICRARNGKVYISEEQPAASSAKPELREFDIGQVLRDMAEFRKSHPAFSADPADFNVSPQNLIYGGDTSSATPATQPADELEWFLRAAAEPWMFSEGSQELRIVNDKLIIVKEPQLIDVIADVLAHLRNDGDIEAARERNAPTRSPPHIDLDQVLEEVNIPLTSLPGALTRLQQISGANIFVKRELVETVPADGFALRAKNITLADALKRLLKGTDLGFMVIDGLIRIEDRYRTERPRPVTHYYDVSDLLARPPESPATLPASEGWDNDPRMAAQQGLIKRIYFAVPDEDWAFGPMLSSDCSIRIIGNVLVVRHSTAVQERIKAALAEMRRSK